jgi:hypothetical protein
MRARQSNLVGPGSFLQHPHGFEDRRANPQLLGQCEDKAWLGARATKVSAQTGDSEVVPKAVSLSETVDDSPFGVSDTKAEAPAHHYLDPAKSEVARSKDVDACGRMVDLRAVAPCRNGQVHPSRDFVAQIPVSESRAQADHALRNAGTHDHEVDLVDPGRLSQLEESAGHLNEETRVAGLIKVTP